MFIIESPDKICCVETKTTEFNGKLYHKALIQFPKGLEWVGTPQPIPVGFYEGYSITFDRGKVSMRV